MVLKNLFSSKVSHLMRTYRFLMFTALSSGWLAARFVEWVSNDPVPIVKDEFWGPGSHAGYAPPWGDEDISIRPFSVDISSYPVVKELRTRLSQELYSGRITPPLEGVAFNWGFNTDYLKEVLSYWLDGYDFESRERYLNRYPHFLTSIGGLEIHFQHIKPNVEGGGGYYGWGNGTGHQKYKKTVPIIFCHGWPGSFVEHQKIIEYFLYPKNSEINFEIVIPSIPGFAWSTSPSRPGMDTIMIANIYGRLMERLGYHKYYTMGEDWGSAVSTDMAMLYPDRVIATHFECFSFHPYDSVKQVLAVARDPAAVFPNARLRERVLPLNLLFRYIIREFGYFHLQASKPDSVGVALNLSPSGMAAYILEKFSTWTDERNLQKADGGLTERFTLDELIDSLMVYWVTGTLTTSMRIYGNSLDRNWHSWKVPVHTPVACRSTPEDLLVAGNGGVSTKFPNLKQYTALDEGGHFAIFEIPHLIAQDALKFFNNIEFNRYDEK